MAERVLRKFTVAAMALPLCLLLMMPSLSFGEAAPSGKKAPLPVPQLRAPTFPKEPDKKPVVAVSPESYVQGASGPENTTVRAVVQKAKPKPDSWDIATQIGWVYATEIANQTFTATGVNYSVHRESTTPMAVQVGVSGKVPFSLFYLHAQFSGAMGDAESSGASGSLARRTFGFQDFQGSAAVEYSLFPRFSGGLRVGLNTGYQRTTYATLNAARNAISSDNRGVLAGGPQVTWIYEAPSMDWEARISGGYALGLGAGTESDAVTERYQRANVGLELSRYLARNHAVGIGVSYSMENSVWNQTVPAVFRDEYSGSDLGIAVFWNGKL